MHSFYNVYLLGCEGVEDRYIMRSFSTVNMATGDSLRIILHN